MFDNRHKRDVTELMLEETEHTMLRAAFMSPEVHVRLQHVASGSRLKEHVFISIGMKSEMKWS